MKKYLLISSCAITTLVALSSDATRNFHYWFNETSAAKRNISSVAELAESALIDDNSEASDIGPSGAHMRCAITVKGEKACLIRGSIFTAIFIEDGKRQAKRYHVWDVTRDGKLHFIPESGVGPRYAAYPEQIRPLWAVTYTMDNEDDRYDTNGNVKPSGETRAPNQVPNKVCDGIRCYGAGDDISDLKGGTDFRFYHIVDVKDGVINLINQRTGAFGRAHIYDLNIYY